MANHKILLKGWQKTNHVYLKTKDTKNLREIEMSNKLANSFSRNLWSAIWLTKHIKNTSNIPARAQPSVCVCRWGLPTKLTTPIPKTCIYVVYFTTSDLPFSTPSEQPFHLWHPKATWRWWWSPQQRLWKPWPGYKLEIIFHAHTFHSGRRIRRKETATVSPFPRSEVLERHVRGTHRRCSNKNVTKLWVFD